jgi:histidinol-phosphate aminotransferase
MHKKSIRKLAQLHGWWVYQTFLKRTQKFSEDQRQQWIQDGLKQTLIRAYEGTVYYREAFRACGFDPRTDFTGVAVMSQLPILTKDIVRERGADLLDSRYSSHCVQAETSGTTGQPTKLWLNPGYIALDYACMYQMWAQAGYRFRDPFLALRSYVPSSESEPLWQRDWAQNTLYMSAYHFSPKTAAEYLREIQQFQPKFIRSYPSSLLVLAQHLEQTGERLPSVRGLFTASETLSERERQSIQRVFGPILYDWYGMTEPTLVAYEGPEHDGLNVVWQYGYPELLVGQGLAEPERRLVATSLHNPGMPFIRYETGDIVLQHPDENPDAAFVRRFGGVRGRKDEVILTPDGRTLPSVNFYSVFRAAEAVKRFQIVQYGTHDIVVNLDAQDPAALRASADYQHLCQELSSRFGPEIRMECRINSRFESSEDGKTPVILRRPGNKAIEEEQAYTLSSKASWTRQRAGESVLKLDWNEADQLPSPRARQAIQELLAGDHALHWYPEAYPTRLHEAIAQHHGLQAEQVIASHGSDMILSALAQCYLGAGDQVMMITPAYDQARALFAQQGAQIHFYNYDGTQPFHFQHFTQQLRELRPRLIYLANPNNPIGYHFSTAQLRQLSAAAQEQNALLLVDEAYAEFAPEDAVPLLREGHPLFLVRTFSKAFGLAGLRIGYLLAQPDSIQLIRRVLNPKQLTSFAQVAALASLEDWPSIQSWICEVKTQRQLFLNFLRERQLRCYESHGNFVLFHVPDPARVAAACEADGVFLRDRSTQVPGTLRATIGSESATRQLMEVLDKVL